MTSDADASRGGGPVAADEPAAATPPAAAHVVPAPSADRAAAVAPTPPAWTRASLPRLPSKVRLQWDDARNQAMLLFPEGVLMLNPTANAVLELVDGNRSLGDIVSELTRKFDATAPRTEAEAVDLSMDPGTDAGEHERVAAGPDKATTLAEREAQIERDVLAFLSGLEERGWLVRELAESKGAAGT
jgi:pyrroloquinoline quinone biosynthesis protein D